MKKKISILLIIVFLLLVSACNKENSSKLQEFEINSKIKYSDLMQDTNEITVLDGSEFIDTSTLGESKVVVKYLLNDELKYKTMNIKIVDKTAPVIKYNAKLSTTKGNKIDLLKDVKITDNSKENIKASIIGDYDINKVGTYKLKYYAIDSSGNSKTEDFTLTVKNVSIKTSGYYVYKGKSSGGSYYEEKKFKKGNKIEVWYNFCPGSGCGGYIEYGTYSIKDNTINVKITSYSDETGKGKTNFLYKCIIKSDTKIVCDKATFTWSKKFK